MEWTVNPLVAIGIGAGIMFFGYFFGLFEGRGKGFKKRPEEKIEEKNNQPVLEPLSPPGAPTPSDEVSVLNLSMDMSGQLRLKMDDQQIETSPLNSDNRKRLIAILTQIRPWLGAPNTAASPAAPRPASVSTPRPVPQPVAAPSEDKDESDAPEKPQSIIMQINSVLQNRLATSALAGKGIRLQESPQGGVIVEVGLNKYQGVDEVPDEEIKAVIKAAITEWENKNTPGL